MYVPKSKNQTPVEEEAFFKPVYGLILGPEPGYNHGLLSSHPHCNPHQVQKVSHTYQLQFAAYLRPIHPTEAAPPIYRCLITDSHGFNSLAMYIILFYN